MKTFFKHQYFFIGLLLGNLMDETMLYKQHKVQGWEFALNLCFDLFFIASILISVHLLQMTKEDENKKIDSL